MIEIIAGILSTSSQGQAGISSDVVTIAQADITTVPQRVDSLAFVVMDDDSLYGVYNHFLNGEGGDEGNSHQRIVTGVSPFESGNYTLSAHDTIPYDDLGDMHASLYRQQTGSDMKMIFLSQSDFDDQVVGLKMRTRTGGVWGTATTISAGAEERWVKKSDAIYRLSDGLLLLPVALRPTIASPTERIIKLWKSEDDGNTWTIVEVIPGTDLEITNPGGTAMSEPGIYEDKDDNIWVHMRSSDGYVKGCKIIRSGVLFDKTAVVDILEAPASTTTIKFIPAINRYLAVHNDPADGTSGFDARKRLRYSLSISGDPGSFVMQPTEIGSFVSGWGHFESTITIYEGGVFIAWTNYMATPTTFHQKVRFITNDMLLNGW